MGYQVIDRHSVLLSTSGKSTWEFSSSMVIRLFISLFFYTVSKDGIPLDSYSNLYINIKCLYHRTIQNCQDIELEVNRLSLQLMIYWLVYFSCYNNILM